jgi:hypothetical protein
MQLLSQLIRRIRSRQAAPVRISHVATRQQAAPDFEHSTANLADCSGEDSASKAQELLDAWMEEDRHRVVARDQRNLP